MNNSSLATEFIKYLVKGRRVCVITGGMGCGKTTLLMSMIKHIPNSLTIRVEETAFELHLRKYFPEKNIVTFQETEYISGQEGLDFSKKTDGDVSIIGEVATDDVALLAIQNTQVAFMFALFTHHANTFEKLIEAFRNSFLKSGTFKDETIAERQVVSALNFDIHLVRENGHRYIERITECIPLVDIDGAHKTNATKSKTNKSYTYQNIIEYRDGKYTAVNRVTKANETAIKKNMTAQLQRQFDTFLNENFTKTSETYNTVGDTQ